MELRYYLYPPAYERRLSGDIENNLKELNKVLTEHNDRLDTFCYDCSLFDVITASGKALADVIFSGMSDVQFQRTIVPKLFNKLKLIQCHLTNMASMNEVFKNSINALWGILFEEEQLHNINSVDKYLKFKDNVIRKALNEDNFRDLKSLLFKKIVFTDKAIGQITTVGDKIFKQIVDRLIDLEAYGRNWNEGEFSIKAVNDRTALNISDESDTVKHNERLSQERYFTLPNSIGGKYCYLHIKTGMFRFHFYPDENKHVIYIAYVGPHLPL